MVNNNDLVLSVPAGGTFDLIEKYHVHAFPNKKSYNYKKTFYITFRQKGGGMMRRVYKIVEKIKMNPHIHNSIKSSLETNPMYAGRLKGYITERIKDFGFEQGDEYLFYLLSTEEIIDLPHLPRPQANNAGPRYYSLSTLTSGNEIIHSKSVKLSHKAWLLAANPKKFNVESVFHDYDFVDWIQSREYRVGDIVYIYVSNPIQKVKFKTRVEIVDLRFEEIRDDKPYWINQEDYQASKEKKFARLRLLAKSDSEFLHLDNLKVNGLTNAPQGPIKIYDEFFEYLNFYFSKDEAQVDDPDLMNMEFVEGHSYKVLVNKYERSAQARQRCIEIHGYICTVCQVNLKSVYGEVAKEFIHVHHLVPLSEIREGYKVDPATDLIPVCPNCHAMLHRKVDGEYLSVESLKRELKNQH